MKTSMPVPGLHLAHMSICPCARPYERGPVYLNFLVNRDEQAFDQQVEAFTLSLETVLQDLGKLPETTFHVVGVDSDDTRFVLEVVIDGSKAQNSRAIFDTVEKLAEERAKDEAAQAEAGKVTVCDICFGKSDSEFPHYKFCAKYSDTPCVVISKMDSIRSKNPGTKCLDSILVGDCHHLLCMDAKKAVAVASEKRAEADAKCAELQAFETSRQYVEAQKQFEDMQVEFCTAELGFRRAEESLMLAKEAAPEDRMDLEKRANDDKMWWTPMLARAAEDLSEATAKFEAAEAKRHSMTLEASTYVTTANFAQDKAAKARGLCGAECPCFTSYIQLEEFYASQMPAEPFVEDFNRMSSAAWQQANQEFFKLPSAANYIGAPLFATITTTSTEIIRVPKDADAKGEIQDISIYSTQDCATDETKQFSLYSTQDGFQKGNSVSIPIPSPADAAKAGETAGDSAGLLEAC